MHFEILVEDASGKIALDNLIPKILGDKIQECSFRVIPYKGIGSIPKDLDKDSDPKKKSLLDKLPTLLRGYGRTVQGYGNGYKMILIFICDIDRRNAEKFKEELNNILKACEPRPQTEFIFAVEEGEAWLLGDRDAVVTAYPKVKTSVLDNYVQDSICGTWELLADAVYPSGAAGLKKEGFPKTGIVKCEWAAEISPLVEINRNVSPSFSTLVTAVNEAYQT